MPQILVVDDSPTIRRMVMSSLRPIAALRFSEAGNGLEAIEQVVLQAPELMILDLNMPDMHGLEVIKFIRAQPTYAELPILVLTTRGDDEARGAVLAAGGSRYLTKPFQPAELMAVVRDLLAIG